MFAVLLTVITFVGRLTYRLISTALKTGSKKPVLVKSVTHAQLRTQSSVVETQVQPQNQDKLLLLIVVFGFVLSLINFLYYYSKGLVLVYKDAQSHLLIAKRVIDSPTPGLAQLGGVWPPLPHLLMQPLVWNDFLFESGIAGSIPSMLCFIVTSVFLYKITFEISNSRPAAVVASVVFMVNPNVGYLQATAMTELPLCMFLSGSVYFFIKWTSNIEKPVANIIYGLLTALMLIGATMTRYEGWILLAIFVPLWAFVCLKKKMPKARVEGEVFYLVFLSSLGIAAWLVWNFKIFHNPFYFQYGEYAKPSLWVGDAERSVGNIWIALKTYSIATYETVGIITVILGSIGLVYFAINERLNFRKIPVYALLFPFPFFVLALYLGQRPLHVEQISGDLYNVRFSLPMILPLAIFTGYLTKNLVITRAMAVVMVIAFSVFTSLQGEIVTLNEPRADMVKSLSVTQRDAAYWLSQNYTSGEILMESYGNEELQVQSGLPIEKIIYEGSYRIWEPALSDPGKFVEWIIMRNSGANQDKVWKSLNDSQALLDRFLLVFETEQIRIYHISSAKLAVATGNP